VIRNRGNTLLPIAITGGKIKINFKKSKNNLLLLVEHCQDLPTINNTAPEPYVKTYLLNKNKDKVSGSKKKTPTSHRTCHPTFNHVIEYIDADDAEFIHVSVWSYSMAGKNEQLGTFLINLEDNPILSGWFPLDS